MHTRDNGVRRCAVAVSCYLGLSWVSLWDLRSVGGVGARSPPGFLVSRLATVCWDSDQVAIELVQKRPNRFPSRACINFLSSLAVVGLPSLYRPLWVGGSSLPSLCELTVSGTCGRSSFPRPCQNCQSCWFCQAAPERLRGSHRAHSSARNCVPSPAVLISPVRVRAAKMGGHTSLISDGLAGACWEWAGRAGRADRILLSSQTCVTYYLTSALVGKPL